MQRRALTLHERDALRRLWEAGAASGPGRYAGIEDIKRAARRRKEGDAAVLALDEAALVAAAEEGIADIEAGLFELILGPADMYRLQADLGAEPDALKM